MNSRPSTAMGFDFGLRRIGVAFGQSLTRTAQPLPPVFAREGIPNWEEIESRINEWQPESIVVGLPLNMDGSVSEMAKRARKFANRLHERFKVPTYLCDERLTSQEAKSIHLSQGGGTDFGQESVDGIAAQLMLETWFAESELIPSHTRLEDLYE